MTTRTSIKDNVEAASNTIGDSIHEFIRDAKPMINQATERAENFATQSLDTASKMKSELEHTSRDLTNHATHMIRNEPFKAMLIAAGVGAAVAALVGLMVRPHTNQRDR